MLYINSTLHFDGLNYLMTLFDTLQYSILFAKRVWAQKKVYKSLFAKKQKKKKRVQKQLQHS